MLRQKMGYLCVVFGNRCGNQTKYFGADDLEFEN